MIKQLALALPLALLAAASGQSAVRVYQGDGVSAAPSPTAVSREKPGQNPAQNPPAAPKTAPIQKPAPAPASTPLPRQPAAAPAQPAQTEQATLAVFINTNDFKADINKKYKQLTAMKELRDLNLPVQGYINDDPKGMMRVIEILGEKQEDLIEFPEDLLVDYEDYNAKSLGIQNQSTIVYRDRTGAVRLYNLSNELEKLQRQLAREVQDAQPAR